MMRRTTRWQYNVTNADNGGLDTQVVCKKSRWDKECRGHFSIILILETTRRKEILL